MSRCRKQPHLSYLRSNRQLSSRIPNLATRNTADFTGTGIELINPWERDAPQGPAAEGPAGFVLSGGSIV